jgi:hypothetical protein
MNLKSYFSEKLSKVLFLEISEVKLKEIFKIQSSESIFMPIKSDDIIQKVKNGENLENIPMSFFVESMFYVMGADEQFKYNTIYIELLKNIPKSRDYIKGVIFKQVSSEKLEDAYILLKGLSQLEATLEIFEKLFKLLESLKVLEPMYSDEERSLIAKVKNILPSACLPHYYECLLFKDEGKFDAALLSLNSYIEKGGELTLDISDLKHSLENAAKYDDGKKLAYEDPTEALKLLLPLIEEFADDAELFYYIAISYRILENYEKAIYYLNEARTIDSNFVEVVNELGINFACLGNYENAIDYFRKAFEVTKSVEICTNIIMCYMDMGDLTNATNHFELAKKLAPNDEIVVKLGKILNKGK